MRLVLHLIALALIFLVTSAAWVGLGGLTHARTSEQQAALYGRVSDLWGLPLTQPAPELVFAWSERSSLQTPLIDAQGRAVLDTAGRPVLQQEWIHQERPMRPASTALQVKLDLDQRRKGLLWFSLYDVDFDGRWTYTHSEERAGTLRFVLQLPTAQGSYDGFLVEVDGQDQGARVVPQAGRLSLELPVEPGQERVFRVRYRSRGLDEWRYQPTAGVGQLDAFSLELRTDFADIDFPASTMSPSRREREGDGWRLSWAFERLVTGDGMGISLPQRVQPGPLAASMAFSAPVSLLFFMAWIFVLGLLKGIEIHPINHLFLAAAFFSFHLLFGYTADRLPVEQAFALASAVSVLLVVSYLRLVVGPRFALVEAGLAQLLYLVGFSLAHFWEGFTGLTVTVLAILTLFALMQLTGRIRWSQVLGEGGLSGSGSRAPSR